MISLESVAMTDIVLNMFIFFFISFSLLYTFSPWKKLDVKLPKAEHGSTFKPQQQINIAISSDGPVYLDGEMLTIKELKKKVYSRYAANPGISVLLCADKRRAFREVVTVLDILSGIGITQLNIATVE
jgi:biopolymer transport protein ExbD